MATATTATRSQSRKKWTSRAVARLVEPGNLVDCSTCGGRIKFQARMRHMQVICNVYESNQWARVEHFHAECYASAGDPYGTPS